MTIRKSIRICGSKSVFIRSQCQDSFPIFVCFPIYDHRIFIQRNNGKFCTFQGGIPLCSSFPGFQIPFLDLYAAAIDLLGYFGRLINIYSFRFACTGYFLYKDGVIYKISCRCFRLLYSHCAKRETDGTAVACIVKVITGYNGILRKFQCSVRAGLQYPCSYRFSAVRGRISVGLLGIELNREFSSGKRSSALGRGSLQFFIQLLQHKVNGIVNGNLSYLCSACSI